jgi:hypothetical protein
MLATVPIENASFSGHESFPLRFSWLKKGYDEIVDNSEFFGTDDAMVILGTGKNMVRAIRHWGYACKTWEKVDGTRGREVQPTEFGTRLLADDGWDPYLEDIGSIWLLHWRLVSNVDDATTWTWTFGRPKANRFRKEELLAELEELVDELELGRTSSSSLKRDVDVLIRSYSRQNRKRSFEDSLDSPLTLLNLIRPASEKGTYELVQGPHPTLPTEILEAALTDFSRQFRKSRTDAISLDDLMYSPMSPGRSFRLTEEALVKHLNEIVRRRPDTYAFDETAGLRQLMIKTELPKRHEVLDEYYQL